MNMFSYYYYHIVRKIKIFTRFILETSGLIQARPELVSNFIFIVGCSHSGTTLLTTIFGRNSEVLAIGDETYVFGQEHAYIKSALKQWDVLCRQLKKKVFLEKTPKHIYEIKKILKYVPDAKIIVTIRNPIDNIASLVKRNNDFKFSYKKFIADNKNIVRFKNDDRVILCNYEDLVTNPEKTVKDLCTQVNITFEENMLHSSSSVFEHWKESEQGNKILRQKQVTKKITNNIGKGRNTFTPQQIQLILKKTKVFKTQDILFK